MRAAFRLMRRADVMLRQLRGWLLMPIIFATRAATAHMLFDDAASATPYYAFFAFQRAFYVYMPLCFATLRQRCCLLLFTRSMLATLRHGFDVFRLHCFLPRCCC